MGVLHSRATLTPSRLVLIGTVLVVSLATTAVFAQAITGHIAAMHAPSADVVVTDYEVTDDDRLEVTVRFHNPATRKLDLEVARVNAYVDGEQVTDGTTSSLGDAAVRSGETKPITWPLGLREGGPERLRNADPEQVEIRGKLKVKVVDELVYVPVGGMEVAG